MPGIETAHRLRDFYDALLEAFGPQHWWPGETRDEMMIGAVLTQNTAWTNVERAIEALKRVGRLTLGAIDGMDEASLADLIRPAGTYRVKAARLKALAAWVLEESGGDLDALFDRDPGALRASLLGVRGIGPETADAILLYAGDVPTFVVDAYTRRILRRHYLIDATAGYDVVKTLFERSLPRDAKVYGEYHALLVQLAKTHCRTTAACDACPLHNSPHDPEL